MTSHNLPPEPVDAETLAYLNALPAPLVDGTMRLIRTLGGLSGDEKVAVARVLAEAAKAVIDGVSRGEVATHVPGLSGLSHTAGRDDLAAVDVFNDVGQLLRHITHHAHSGPSPSEE